MSNPYDQPAAPTMPKKKKKLPKKAVAQALKGKKSKKAEKKANKQYLQDINLIPQIEPPDPESSIQSGKPGIQSANIEDLAFQVLTGLKP